jgi:hypothetical protein
VESVHSLSESVSGKGVIEKMAEEESVLAIGTLQVVSPAPL